MPAAVVAIDAATGERRWVYQTVHRDIWDYDVPSQPVLVDIRKNGEGELIPAVAQPTKRGEIFLLDRRTGVPIYDTPEMAVPQDPAAGRSRHGDAALLAAAALPRRPGREGHVGADPARPAALPDRVQEDAL